MIQFHFGTQSWNFRAWIGPFYPPDTNTENMLRLYGRMFSTIEVDSSFYGIPAAPVLRSWREKVPGDFLFALKVPQQITHTKRLAGRDNTLDESVERSVRANQARRVCDLLGDFERKEKVSRNFLSPRAQHRSRRSCVKG